MKNIDWGSILVRRLPLIAFVVLTFLGVVQATGFYTIWNGMQPYFMMDESFKQALFTIFWPITHAPLWWKISYFTLGFWLIHIYRWWPQT